MACSMNFHIKSTKYQNISYKIPCRRCMLCRIENRKMWEERSRYEFKKHITGTFLTLTYDEEHLNLIKANDNEIRNTLKYDEVRKYIENIRKYCKDHEEENNTLRQKDFTYIGVGEYGTEGAFNRAHWHILLFGLDPKYNEKLFEQKWGKGFIQAKPILNGAIRYILKYMDKQIMGKESRWEYYRRWGLEEPKLFHSKGLGAELYYTNYENIKQNKGVIKTGQKYIQVPNYYKNKMGIIISEKEINEARKQKLDTYEINTENANKYIANENKYNYIQNQQINEIQKLNEKLERNEIAKAHNLGIPVEIKKYKE